MSHLQQQEALLGSPSGKQPSSFSLSPQSLDSRCSGVSREALRSSEKSHKTEPMGKHPQALVGGSGMGRGFRHGEGVPLEEGGMNRRTHVVLDPVPPR